MAWKGSYVVWSPVFFNINLGLIEIDSQLDEKQISFVCIRITTLQDPDLVPSLC